MESGGKPFEALDNAERAAFALRTYALLRVAVGCGEAAVKKAYKKASLQYHPDKQGGKSASDQELAAAMFLKVKEAYVSSGGPQKFKLAKGPPRPPTAYFIFLTNFRKERNASGAEPASIKDISKMAGQKWREMDPSDKVPFEQKAARAKVEYLKLKALTAEERVAAVGIKNPYAPFL